jgi:hypothetical protein
VLIHNSECGPKAKYFQSENSRDKDSIRLEELPELVPLELVGPLEPLLAVVELVVVVAAVEPAAEVAVELLVDLHVQRLLLMADPHHHYWGPL